MAIAPSKLGQLVLRHERSEKTLVRVLREAGLVSPEASDDDLRAVFAQAREEHASLGEMRIFNSPHERVRVFLEPHLTEKGRQWAVPLRSLDLPDDPATNRRPWWRFW
jgi:hypothetical protein